MTSHEANALPGWVLQALENASEEGVANKRADIRHYYSAMLLAVPCDGPSTPPMHVRAFNISERGIGLILRTPIDAGIDLAIVPEDGQGEAVRVRVMHCTQTLQGYKVGCMFPS